MELQADPIVIEKLAEELAEENWRFRTFLKYIDLESEEIDAIVHRLYEEVASRIDCRACGNCCRQILPTLDEDDVDRLAGGLEKTSNEIIVRYLMTDDDGNLTFNRRPCPFLSENRCLVYEHRPEICRSYPHLRNEEFVFRLAQAVINCSVCPISFHVYERLKDELWFQPNDDWEEEWA